MSEVTVNFVARDQPHGGWALVLVEEGPWEVSAVGDQLRRVQDRLYACLDAVLDGVVAERFPDSLGKPLLIRLEAYDIPNAELGQFFARFASEVPKLPDYAAAIASCTQYPSIRFELMTAATKPAV